MRGVTSDGGRQPKKPAEHLARFPGGARAFCGLAPPRERLVQERYVWHAMDAEHRCRRCADLAAEDAKREIELTDGIARWDEPVVSSRELKRWLQHAERTGDLFSDTERSLIVWAIQRAERTRAHRAEERRKEAS